MPEAYDKAQQRRLIAVLCQQAISNQAEQYWPERAVEATIIDTGSVQVRIKGGSITHYYTIKVTANW